MKNVTIYTTPTCSFCHMTKGFFKQNNVEYTEVDLTQNQDAIKEVVEATGQMGVPVTKVEDQYVVGFDKDTLSRLLDIKA